MINNPEALRHTINEELSLLADPRFEASPNGEKEQCEYMARIISDLRDEKAAFFERYSYGWACEVSAYNSSLEMILQWRLLNAISDIPSDRPALDRCAGLVVRLLPSSCARPHTRQIGNYKVVVLTRGYLSVLKGFVRLWLRGCALGRLSGRERPKSYKEAGETYLLGLKNNEAAMMQSALAYGGNFSQLLQNEIPFMDRESVFDGEVLTREEHGAEFALLCTAVDGFLLFHEVRACIKRRLLRCCRTVV